ncbi:maleylpyruvate isomerase family mycothiol-dependent enzyme [Kitasatospora sp. MAP5-34]|uniref:maleylpyruvate isomerase family mycothiol-dependent enzyme n=1 Tax=Kitasatospora sp. MAP5-34 TaxID=3035102 RepID=UPI0024730C7E|nr:maleylpyruvate isomerase family mycothiol-dependent enzyme [Kitasatospora sp. MAP5-34]MDH6577626.1 uncharacterized protein (TIGR03083 family) [Kitasatospora sp. MAP5-34]
MSAAGPAASWDADIRARLARGEETALGELYDRYAPAVHELAGRLLPDAAAAERLAREVFHRLWAHPEESGPEESGPSPLGRRLEALTHRLAPDQVSRPPGNGHLRLDADDPIDPDGTLRRQVLNHCLTRRTPVFPLPAWAAPYAAESAKLDNLLRDLSPTEWQEIAELPWYGGVQRWRPREVLCHLTAVDGYLARPLGLPDPVPTVPPGPDGVLERTEALAAAHAGSAPAVVRTLWRRQSQGLVRAAASGAGGSVLVDYGFAALPLRDAFVDRAFECWIHGDDVARAVDYPYPPPTPAHLRLMIDLAARMLPAALAALRGPQAPARPGRLLRLVVEGPAAGEWLVPLDGPDSPAGTGEPVASMVLDGLEFCYLAAAHRDPGRVPVGEYGDRDAVREVLRAAPLLSRP